MTTAAYVGDAIEVYWPDDKDYYSGKVIAHDASRCLYRVQYDDGEVEEIDLAREQWRFAVQMRHHGNPRTQPSNASLLTTQAQRLTQLGTRTSPSLNHCLSHGASRSSPRSARKHSAESQGRLRVPNSCADATVSRGAAVSHPLTVRRSARIQRLSKYRANSPPLNRVSKRQGKQANPISAAEVKNLAPHSILSAASINLIESCIELWLEKEIRRRCSMFSIYQCLTFAFGMLTCSALDRGLEVKILNKKRADAEWILRSSVQKRQRDKYFKWKQPLTDTEWESEKVMLAEISTLISKCANSVTRVKPKSNNTSSLEAMRIVLHARVLHSTTK